MSGKNLALAKGGVDREFSCRQRKSDGCLPGQSLALANVEAEREIGDVGCLLEQSAGLRADTFTRF